MAPFLSAQLYHWHKHPVARALLNLPSLHALGSPYGLIGEFAFTVTTKQPLLFSLRRAQKYPGL